MDFRWGFPGGSEVKVSAWNSGDPGLRKMVMMMLYGRQQKRHRCKEQTFGLWGKTRVG